MQVSRLSYLSTSNKYLQVHFDLSKARLPANDLKSTDNVHVKFVRHVLESKEQAIEIWSLQPIKLNKD